MTRNGAYSSWLLGGGVLLVLVSAILPQAMTGRGRWSDELAGSCSMPPSTITRRSMLASTSTLPPTPTVRTSKRRVGSTGNGEPCWSGADQRGASRRDSALVRHFRVRRGVGRLRFQHDDHQREVMLGMRTRSS